MPSTFAPLATPAYRRVWAAAVVSHVGSFLQLTAAPWLMQELTASPLYVSLVTACLLLPRLVLSPFTGALTDQVERRTLLIVGQLVSAAATGALAVVAFLGLVTPGLLLAAMLVLGAGTAIGLPSFQTLVPDLAPAPLRAQAITLNSAAFNVARAVGPSLGGALVAAGLASAAFGLNAATFLLVTATLLTLSPQGVGDDHAGGMWRQAAVGVRFARVTRPIRRLLALTVAFAATATSVQALLPSVVADDLGLGASAYGLLFGCFGGGALVGALLRDRARGRLGRGMLPVSIGGFGLAGVVFGLSVGPVTAAAGLLVAGTTWVWTLTTLNASIQLLAPRWVRGRVISLYVVAMGLQPVGALGGGVLAEEIGAGAAVAVLTAATALLGVVAWRADVPNLDDIVEPVVPEDVGPPPHADQVDGSPIVVATTWQIDPRAAAAFTDALRRLRAVRLRTGAYRWDVYRDAGEPCRITEVFAVPDWDEHLAQHRRLDVDAVAAIEHARTFDVDGGPTTRHMAGVDLRVHHAAPVAARWLREHTRAHRSDGSVPEP